MVAERLQPAAITFVCPSMTVRGTLVEGHLFLGGKGFSQFHKTTIWGRKTNSGANILHASVHYSLLGFVNFIFYVFLYVTFIQVVI